MASSSTETSRAGSGLSSTLGLAPRVEFGLHVAPKPEPLFLTTERGALGQRFALYHAPHGHPCRGMVVHVHPFAEEMNKARRMAALQSRALAAAGFAVLQMDLLGCGDSAGDFGDATWGQWVADVVHACHWLQQRAQSQAPAGQAAPPLWLWGLRAGCLLAVEAGQLLHVPCNFIFWQAPLSGRPLLQQFLRLKVAAGLLGGTAKGVMEQLRSQLAAGQPVDVAGYTLHPALCLGLERAALLAPTLATMGAGRAEWLEVSTQADAVLSPASVSSVASWATAGWHVRTQVVQGPTFWQTTEIEEAPALVAATLAALTGPLSMAEATTMMTDRAEPIRA